MSAGSEKIIALIDERLGAMEKLDGNDVVSMQNELLECRELLGRIKEVFYWVVV